MFTLISAKLPAAVSLFWTYTQIVALSERFLLDSPKVRRIFKIPKTPYELKNPFIFKYERMLESLFYITKISKK